MKRSNSSGSNFSRSSPAACCDCICDCIWNSACSSISRNCARRRSTFSDRSVIAPLSCETSFSMRAREMLTSPARLTRRSSVSAPTRTTCCVACFASRPRGAPASRRSRPPAPLPLRRRPAPQRRAPRPARRPAPRRRRSDRRPLQLVEQLEAAVVRRDQFVHQRRGHVVQPRGRLDACLEVVDHFAEPHRASHPRAALQRVQVTQQHPRRRRVVAMRLPGAQQLADLRQDLAAFLDEHVEQVRIDVVLDRRLALARHEASRRGDRVGVERRHRGEGLDRRGFGLGRRGERIGGFDSGFVGDVVDDIARRRRLVGHRRFDGRGRRDRVRRVDRVHRGPSRAACRARRSRRHRRPMRPTSRRTTPRRAHRPPRRPTSPPVRRRRCSAMPPPRPARTTATAPSRTTAARTRAGPCRRSADTARTGSWSRRSS